MSQVFIGRVFILKTTLGCPLEIFGEVHLAYLLEEFDHCIKVLEHTYCLHESVEDCVFARLSNRNIVEPLELLKEGFFFKVHNVYAT